MKGEPGEGGVSADGTRYAGLDKNRPSRKATDAERVTSVSLFDVLLNRIRTG